MENCGNQDVKIPSYNQLEVVITFVWKSHCDEFAVRRIEESSELRAASHEAMSPSSVGRYVRKAEKYRYRNH